MKKDDAQKPVCGENVLLESRTVCQLLYRRKNATELEMTSLEHLGLVRGRARRIQGIREELENSQPTGTSSSTRSGTVRVVRVGAAGCP